MEPIESVKPGLKSLGYRIKPSSTRSPVWYLTHIENGNLYALIFQNGQWIVNEISGTETERQQLEQTARAITCDQS